MRKYEKLHKFVSKYNHVAIDLAPSIPNCKSIWLFQIHSFYGVLDITYIQMHGKHYVARKTRTTYNLEWREYYTSFVSKVHHVAIDLASGLCCRSAELLCSKRYQSVKCIYLFSSTPSIPIIRRFGFSRFMVFTMHLGGFGRAPCNRFSMRITPPQPNS